MSCSQLYLGTDIILNLAASNTFSIELLSAQQDTEYPDISSILQSTYIYYLAPHTGCGCGWDILHTGMATDERASVAQLKTLLDSLVKHQHRVLILSTCLGHEAVRPDHTELFSVDGFIEQLTDIRVGYGEAQAKLFEIRPL